MPMNVYYSVNGQNLQPLPSTGMFGSMGKQSTAISQQDAEAKAKAAMQQNKLMLPQGAKFSMVRQEGPNLVAMFQNGGRRRKSRRGASKSRSRTRKLRGKKSRRSRR